MFRKTLFAKFLYSNFLIIFVCLVVLSSLLYSFVSGYILQEKKDLLREEALRFNDLTVFYQDNQTPPVTALYTMTTNDICRRLGGVLFLVSRDGHILMQSENFAEYVTGEMSQDFVRKLFDGEQTHLGNSDGIFRDTHFMVSIPVSYRGETPAVTCIAVPIPELNSYRTSIVRATLLATVCTLAIASLLSFLISRRISRPLRMLSAAALQIANGDFDVKLPTRGDDEIATLNTTFNQMAFSLKKLEDMRSGFISSVSHELRTPMTTISGFMEGILDGTVPKERQREYLTIALSETRRLSRLVNELLVLTRLEDGTVQLNLTDFDLNELIRITLLRFEARFTQENIRPDIKFDEEHCIVHADKDAIDRVLINLFDNALKFNIPQGYVRVSVTQTETLATVSVENSGIGMNDEELKFIWDKFYKTDKSRGCDKTGVGLGLYLVRNILQSHGEKIWAESVQNEYARFTFTLKKK